jgi:integrase
MSKATGTRGFGAIRKLPSGRFQVRYWGSDGMRHAAPVTYVTRADAKAFLATIQSDITRATWRAPVQSNETVGQYVTRWIDQHTGLKASTRGLYEGLNRLHISPTDLGRQAMADVGPDDVRRWYASLRKSLAEAAAARSARRTSVATKADGSTTAAQAYRLLRAVMNTATADGMFTRSPCHIKGAGSVVVAERPTATPAEVSALAAAMPDRYRVLVLMAAWTGARMGELAALRRRDLDLDQQTVRIAERVYRVGKVLDWDSPKSKAGNRTVSLPPHLVPPLADHLAEFTGPDEDDLVFTTSGGKPLENSNITPMWARARRTVGREDLRFHDLRHTGQTLAAIAGATEAELMHRMGHSTTSASRVYLHSTAEHGRAVASALSELATSDNVIPLRSTTRRTSRASGV